MVLGLHPGEYVVATLYKAPSDKVGAFLLTSDVSQLKSFRN